MSVVADVVVKDESIQCPNWMPLMRTLVFATLMVIFLSPFSLRAENWQPENLKGAWLITYCSSDGEEAKQAKNNILIFHENQMVFAFDRNYGPPNAELGATGYELYSTRTYDSKSYGLARVQRGVLKFALEHNEEKGRETITVIIEDRPNNRIREIVHFKAERMETGKAHARIRWLLGSPKFESVDARTDSVEAAEAWLQANGIAESIHEPKSP